MFPGRGFDKERLVRSTARACTAVLDSSILLQGDRQRAWEALHPHLSLLDHQGDPEPLCTAGKLGWGAFPSEKHTCFLGSQFCTHH